MTPSTIFQLQQIQKRLHAAISNRLTYPKTLLDIACDRTLIPEESHKACECLEACLRIVDAELTVFLSTLDDSLPK